MWRGGSGTSHEGDVVTSVRERRPCSVWTGERLVSIVGIKMETKP